MSFSLGVAYQKLLKKFMKLLKRVQFFFKKHSAVSDKNLKHRSDVKCLHIHNAIVAYITQQTGGGDQPGHRSDSAADQFYF